MNTTQTVQQAVPAGTYTVDPIHSTIHFAVIHNGVSAFRSGFLDYAATLEGGDSPKLEGTVEVASIDIDEEALKGHLASPDFFDAERFPQLKFSSTAIELDEGNEVTVRGNLEIRGTVHEVEASGRIGQVGADLGGSARVGLSLATRVDRRSFGLDWNADLPSGGQALDYEVEIAVELEFVAEAE
jgi:polyisoprenoid-binding protein YceI